MLVENGDLCYTLRPYAAAREARASLLEKGGEFKLTKVYLRDGESPENLLKRFRKKVTRDGILSTVKKKRFFVSKSEQKRIALRKAMRREPRERAQHGFGALPSLLERHPRSHGRPPAARDRGQTNERARCVVRGLRPRRRRRLRRQQLLRLGQRQRCLHGRHRVGLR